jgi:nucleotide-binding universal stress UspA family protein
MYNRVVVPLDGSNADKCVLSHITTLALKGLVTTLIFIQVAEGPFMPSVVGRPFAFSPEWGKSEPERRAVAESYLRGFAGKLRFDGVKIFWHSLPYGNIVEMIAGYVKEIRADLLVMAAHRRSWIGRLIWGSKTEHIISSVSIPVFIVNVPPSEQE